MGVNGWRQTVRLAQGNICAELTLARLLRRSARPAMLDRPEVVFFNQEDLAEPGRLQPAVTDQSVDTPAGDARASGGLCRDK